MVLTQWSSEHAGRVATPLSRVLATIHGNLSSAGFNPREILKAIDRIQTGRLWEGEVDERGRPMTLQRALMEPWPTGVGLTSGDIDRILQIARDRELDPDLIRRVDLAVSPQLLGRGRPGKDYNIIFSDEEQGTARRYTLRRLRRDYPELAERVAAGKISANAAAIEAGIRHRTITVRVDSVEKAIDTLLKHYSKEELLKALEGNRCSKLRKTTSAPSAAGRSEETT